MVRLLQSSGEMRGMPFGIALPAALISRSGSFVAISPTSPALGVAEAASCEGVVTECEVRDALKQVGLNKSPGTRWFALRSVLEDVAHVCTYSDGYVQPLVRPGSPSLVALPKGVITLLKKGGRHVWGGFRRLQAHNSA